LECGKVILRSLPHSLGNCIYIVLLGKRKTFEELDIVLVKLPKRCRNPVRGSLWCREREKSLVIGFLPPLFKKRNSES